VQNTLRGTVGVQSFVDSQRFRAYHYGVFALCVLGLLFDGFDVQSMGFVAPAMRADMGFAASALGPVFSASLFGMLIGALIFGSLADRIGRRPVLIGALALCGVAMCYCSTATSLHEVMIVRFITGLGLGTMLPTSLAVASEIAPSRYRSVVVMLMSLGFVGGAALGGAIAAHLIPAHGWRSVFVFAGVGSLISAVVQLLWLPEPLQFIVESSGGGELPRAMKVARKLSGDRTLPDFVWQSERMLESKVAASRSIAEPFREGYAATTLLLWVINFANLLDLYLMSSWLPTLLSQAKLPLQTAVIASTVLQSGGVPATLLLSVLSRYIRLTSIMVVNFLIGTAAMITIGFAVHASVPLLFVAIFLAGFCVVGGQSGVNALGAYYYPTTMRAAGMGWASGIGRFGSVSGPLFGGMFLILGWGPEAVFFGAASAGLLGMLATFVLQWRARPAAHELGAAVAMH